MLQSNTFYRTSIKALIFDEKKKILLAKDSGENRWDLPGGGMDWGETPQTCLVREIQEEMGIPVTWIADHPSYFYSGKNREVWFTYTIYEAKLEHFSFTPSDECIDVGFFTLEEAKEKELWSNVVKFIELYNPKNHLV